MRTVIRERWHAATDTITREEVMLTDEEAEALDWVDAYLLRNQDGCIAAAMMDMPRGRKDTIHRACRKAGYHLGEWVTGP